MVLTRGTYGKRSGAQAVSGSGAASARTEVVRERTVETVAACGNTGIAIGECGCGKCGGAGGGGGDGGYGGGTVGLGAQQFAARARAARATADAAAAAAAAAAGAANVAGNWTVGLEPDRGCYSRAMSENLDGMGVMLSGNAWRPAPYQDPVYDFCNMDELFTDLDAEAATILPGATNTLTLAPEQGTFGAFYWDVVVVDPTTQVEQDDWRATRPRVRGCPTPCNVTGPMLAQFHQMVPEQCCGKPFKAFLDRSSEQAPLEIDITNNQTVGNLLAQLRVRGYCCSTKVCW